MDAELVRLHSLLWVQSAELFAMLTLVKQIAALAGPALPDPAAMPDAAAIDATYVRLRKEFLHQQLEAMESTRPDLAAAIQQHLEATSKHFPLGYE